MIAVSEDDLICDLAETYGIYDIRNFPVRTLAALASGLRENSRIKKRMARPKEGNEAEPRDIDTDTLLLARIADSLSWIVWSKTKDGQKGQNMPKSLVNILLQKNEEEEKANAYNSPEDFEKAWKKKGGGVIGRNRN